MTSSNDLLIEAREIVKTYQMGMTHVHALRNVDLEVKHGEFVALMGASGSGKSTLMHLLGCLDEPDSGTYLLEKQNVFALSNQARAHLRSTRIGFIFQTFNLLPAYSALENVILPLLYQGQVTDAETRGIAALKQVSLSKRARHRPNELSGGERQRVAIARALVTQPALILADEPTGNLDSDTGGEIMKLLLALHEQGRSILMVTHDAKIAGFAQRVLHMHDGRLLEKEAAT